MTATQFKETEIGTIPQEWEVWSIWENCDLLTWFPFKWNMYDDKEWIRVLRGENVSLWFIRRDSDKKRKHDTSDLNKYFLQDLDLVVWMDWSRVWRNRAMIKVTDLPLLLAQRVARIRAKWNLDQKFLSYQILHEQFEEFVDKLKTWTSIPHISGDQLKSYPIILPPLPEQQAIASTLGSLDDKIELLREQNKTLEAMGQAIFKSRFVDFNYPWATGEVEDSELGPIPKGWKIMKLTDIANFLNGLALQKYPPIETEETLPVIKIRELKSWITEGTDLCSKDIPIDYITNNWDMLFSWSWSLETCLRTSGLWALNQHLFKVSSDTYPQWLYWYRVNEHLNDFKVTAESKATTMWHIKREHLEKALVVIPDVETMKLGSQHLQPLLSKIISNWVQIQSLTQTRDNLLPRLMSGKVRVLV